MAQQRSKIMHTNEQKLAKSLAMVEATFAKVKVDNAAYRAKLTPEQLASHNRYLTGCDAWNDRCIEREYYSNDFADQVRGDYRLAQRGY
jgi:hypothetical protein